MNREYVHSVAVYRKIYNDVGRIENFRAFARKLSFLPTELDTFDIRQQYVSIVFIFKRLILLIFIPTPRNTNLAVHVYGLGAIMTSYMMLTAS